ncbi:MAG: TetR/AcrR family transcriptional regulator [Lachnospiraceae bacterium]|nr:TetR/AcrR family transcriptional regulator [Lachnospiraceae bacterium]
MPKVIENIKEKLLVEARKQVMEQGYSAMTIRSVAGACGVGVGTVYNYFSSKDMLVASFMLEDWQNCMEKIQDCSEKQTEPQAILKCVYDELKRFSKEYASLFQDKDAGIRFANVFPQRHEQLRSQIAGALKSVCKNQKKADVDFLTEFIAENMLTWTLANRTFEEIGSVLLQLF